MFMYYVPTLYHNKQLLKNLFFSLDKDLFFMYIDCAQVISAKVNAGDEYEYGW